MLFNTLNMSESAKVMSKWKESPTNSYLNNVLGEELEPDEMNLRKELIAAFESIDSKQKYMCDLLFGLKMYEILDAEGFRLRDASNDDTWRYISLKIIPDIVGKRWGKSAEIRYYKQSTRIWLKTIWWYVYLSWQGDAATTKRILSTNSTDQILQLVDRSGSKGYYVEVYQKIMYYYWIAKNSNNEVGENEFRKIMVLHTAVCQNIEPAFHEGGEDGYVRNAV